LEENRPDVLAALDVAGDLDEYLASVGESAEELLDYLMRQYATSPAVQALPYLDRVRLLQACQQAAEEVIRHDIICQPIEDWNR
jgi:hypothetical protein